MTDVTKIENAIYDLEDYISVPEAEKITGVSNVTIIEWCKKYRIGIKVGGRWRVDIDKLALLLKGNLKKNTGK
jgi:hypothetical protein